jgi:hypothetical protein
MFVLFLQNLHYGIRHLTLNLCLLYFSFLGNSIDQQVLLIQVRVSKILLAALEEVLHSLLRDLLAIPR